MFAIAGTTSTFTIASSNFYSTRAYNGHGGFVYLYNTGATTMSLTSSYWNYATASQDGGFARISGGTDVTVTMSGSNNYLYNSWASGNGGGFRIDSSGIATITMQSGTYMN